MSAADPAGGRTDPDCLFCKIVNGAIPATIALRTARTVAFRDLNPQAPTHCLVIPVEHYPDAPTAAAADPALIGELVDTARAVAEGDGVAESGYRLVFNLGPDAGQSVFHVHLHVLGGRALAWPPG